MWKYPPRWSQVIESPGTNLVCFMIHTHPDTSSMVSIIECPVGMRGKALPSSSCAESPAGRPNRSLFTIPQNALNIGLDLPFPLSPQGCSVKPGFWIWGRFGKWLRGGGEWFAIRGGLGGGQWIINVILSLRCRIIKYETHHVFLRNGSPGRSRDTWQVFQVPTSWWSFFPWLNYRRVLLLNGPFDVAAHIIQNTSFTADFDMSLNECIFSPRNGNTV